MQFKRKYFIAFLFVGAILFIGGCDYFSDGEKKAEAPKMPLMKVSVMQTQKSDIPLYFEYPATIKSIQEAAIIAKVPGTLLSQHFTEGSFVKKGTLLYTIDPEVYEAKAQSAEANLAQSEAAFKQATRDMARGEKLKAQEAISERDYDTLVSAYERAEAQVKYAKALLKESKINLEYCSVKAPFDGIAGKNIQDLGNYVGTSSANTTLTTLTKTDTLQAEFSIPQSDLARGINLEQLRSDAQIKIKLLGDGYEDAPIGKIDFIDSKIDPVTQSVQARAVFENNDGRLIAGSFARIVIEGVYAKEVVAIPQKAVMQTAQGALVYTLVDSKVTPTPVVLGDTTKELQIVLSGLKGGETLILDNFIKIRPAMPVEAIETGKEPKPDVK